MSLSASLLLPYRCLVCGKRLWQSPLCVRCTPLIPFPAARCPICWSFDSISHPPAQEPEPCLLCRLIPSPFQAVRYLWGYEHEARRLIAAMKYRPSAVLCGVAGKLLANALPHLALPGGYDLLVPIPSSPSSLARRGFNQCILLGRSIKRNALHETEFAPRALIHRGSPHAQASLAHARRIHNVRRSFQADATAVQKKNILLLDDVLTTGATSTAAALALLDAGAAGVDLLVLARSDAWTSFRHQVRRAYHVAQPLKQCGRI